MEGKKDDSEKPRCSLVLGDFARALLAVSQVGTFGARKYEDHNWLKVENGFERYSDALVRHLLQGSYEPYDNESGLSHAAHAAWNALARLELILRYTEEHEFEQSN